MPTYLHASRTLRVSRWENVVFQKQCNFVSLMKPKLINFDIELSLWYNFSRALIVFQEGTSKTWKEHCISVSEYQIELLFS